MADYMHWAALLLSTFVAFICDCKPLDGYKFPVYTTESCPRNQTEWMERSSAINCTESNGYLCLPSEELTELLEFCYFEYQIPIAKGLCMFLRKRDSFIDDYSCRNFVEGCPNSTYRINEAYKYRSCLSIYNGCFLAETNCTRTTKTYHILTTPGTTASIEETSNNIHENTQLHEKNEWVWIIALLGTGAIICLPVIMFCIKKKSTAGENNDIENNIMKDMQDSFIDRLQPNSVNDNLCIQQLRDKGVDVNLCDENNRSPLYDACYEGHEDTVQLLLNKGADINLCRNTGESTLSVACRKGHAGFAQLLLERGVDVNLCDENNRSPLYDACYEGQEGTVKLLLKNGADINLCRNTGESTLSVACRKGHAGIAQLLLDRGMNVNLRDKEGQSPLYNACYEGHEDTVQLLLNNGADINLSRNDGDSTLSVACRKGHAGIAQLLLDRGVNVNLCDKEGQSPLYDACYEGQENAALLLLNNGAETEADPAM